MNLVLKILLIVISVILVIALALPSILNLKVLHPKFDGNIKFSIMKFAK
jgi:hypothetical protein